MKIAKYLNKYADNIFILSLCIIALEPLFNLDYLLSDYLPVRFTTLINFILLPCLIIILFLIYEKKKKRIIIFGSIYALLFLIYFYLHCKNADHLSYNLYLPDNYVFVLKDEIVYTFTLLLPLVYIYILYLGDLREILLEKMSIITSLCIAPIIVLANLFTFGLSTYERVRPIANIFSWFSLPYDETIHRPRYYAAKFLFKEGNTIGILLCILLPLLYYFFLKSDKKKRIYLGILIFIHSLAMIILSTRIATYLALLIPIIMLMMHFILFILKKAKLNKIFIIFTLCLSLLTGAIIPFSPAYQNQKMDALDYAYQIEKDNDRKSAKDIIKRDGQNLEPYSKEWLDYWTYVFEDWVFMIGVTPPVYYTEWYDYHHDPKFWCDLIFDYELAQRVNGRQIENIFTKYKWDMCNNKEKLLGMGYSTFMHGGIVIEQDFKMQYYAYGPLGFSLLCLPWLILMLYGFIKLLFSYKKWNTLNITLYLSMGIGMASAYLSGHVLDELQLSLWLAIIFAYFFKGLKYGKA